MAIRLNNTQSRSGYIGSLTNIVPNLGEFLVSGKLGVGNTSPDYELDVTGTLGVSSSAIFGGNVGIGTTSPTSTLQVDGQVLISATAPFLDFVDTNSFTDTDDRFRIRAGTNEGSIQWIDATGEDTTTFMNFKNTGDVVIPSNNLGVRVTSPSYAVDVLGASAAVLGVRSSGFAGIDIISDRDSGNLGGVRVRHSGDTAQSVEILGLIGGSVDFKLGGSGEIGPSSKVRFDSDGNVGIGTTNPVTKLHISNNTKINDAFGLVLVENTATGGSAATNSSVNVKNDNGTSQFMQWEENGLRIGSRIITNIGLGHVIFTSGADSEKMRILENGNIGIGTTIPGAKLEINTGGAAGGFKLYGSNSSYTAAFIANTGSGNAGVYMDGINGDFSGGDYGFIGQEDSGYMLYNIGASSPSPYHVFTGGNVGIGTNSPSYKLDVGGIGKFKDKVLIDGIDGDFANLESTSGHLLAGVDVQDGVFQYADGVLSSSGGKVGVNVLNPFSKLQVGTKTFDGTNGMYTSDRVGISNHGALTGMMLASTYNSADHAEYGLVFVQGPSTADYNVWSISPDGPAKGSSLSFHYEKDSANIHLSSNAKVTISGATGNVGIGDPDPEYRLTVVGNASLTNGTGNLGLQGPVLDMFDSTFANKAWRLNADGEKGKFELRSMSDGGSQGTVSTRISVSHSDGFTQISGVVKTLGYQSTDGSNGLTGSFSFVDHDSATRTLTIKNGLITAKS